MVFEHEFNPSPRGTLTSQRLAIVDSRREDEFVLTLDEECAYTWAVSDLRWLDRQLKNNK